MFPCVLVSPSHVQVLKCSEGREGGFGLGVNWIEKEERGWAGEMVG